MIVNLLLVESGNTLSFGQEVKENLSTWRSLTVRIKDSQKMVIFLHAIEKKIILGGLKLLTVGSSMSS